MAATIPATRPRGALAADSLGQGASKRAGPPRDCTTEEFKINTSRTIHLFLWTRQGWEAIRFRRRVKATQPESLIEVRAASRENAPKQTQNVKKAL